MKDVLRDALRPVLQAANRPRKGAAQLKDTGRQCRQYIGRPGRLLMLERHN